MRRLHAVRKYNVKLVSVATLVKERTVQQVAARRYVADSFSKVWQSL